MAVTESQLAAAINQKSITSLPVNCLLLSPKNENRTKASHFSAQQSLATDFLHLLVGKYYQDKLKQVIRRNTTEYVCQVCHGTGILTAIEGSSRKEFTEALYTLLTMTAQPVVFSSINKLFGLSSTGKFQSELYEQLGKKFYTQKNYIIDQKKKNKKRFTQQEKPDEIAKIEAFLLKNFGNFSGLASFIQPCPACDAKGYYDIGHVFDFGKQVDMMLYIYRKYIVQGTGDWEERWKKEVPVQSLLDRFLKLKIQPEIPYRIKNIGSFTKAQALAISKYKINRDNVYVDITKSVKEELYKQFDEIRKKGGPIDVDKSQASFLEVFKFFERMSSTARVQTGTLRKSLQRQKVGILQHYSKMKALYNTDSMADTPFPSSGFVVDGPTSGERLGHKTTGNSKSILFVYASMYIPSRYYEGKGKSNVIWGKGKTISSIIKDSFSKPDQVLKTLSGKYRPSSFIKFFPQRVA